MKIAICDDEHVQQQYLKQIITEYGKEKHTPMEVECFGSSEELLFHYPEGLPFELLILDIQMKKMSGIELAEEIRRKDKQIKIIFLTGYETYALKGYTVGAARYLLKPLKEEELFQAMEELQKETEQGEQNYFGFQYLGEYIKLAYQDVYYVAVDGHYLHMHTAKEDYIWKGTLASAKQMLFGEDFVQANRSVILNMRHVDRIRKESAQMDDGSEVEISRNHYKKVNQRFIEMYF